MAPKLFFIRLLLRKSPTLSLFDGKVPNQIAPHSIQRWMVYEIDSEPAGQQIPKTIRGALRLDSSGLVSSLETGSDQVTTHGGPDYLQIREFPEPDRPALGRKLDNQFLRSGKVEGCSLEVDRAPGTGEVSQRSCLCLCR